MKVWKITIGKNTVSIRGPFLPALSPRLFSLIRLIIHQMDHVCFFIHKWAISQLLFWGENQPSAKEKPAAHEAKMLPRRASVKNLGKTRVDRRIGSKSPDENQDAYPLEAHSKMGKPIGKP